MPHVTNLAERRLPEPHDLQSRFEKRNPLKRKADPSWDIVGSQDVSIRKSGYEKLRGFAQEVLDDLAKSGDWDPEDDDDSDDESSEEEEEEEEEESASAALDKELEMLITVAHEAMKVDEDMRKEYGEASEDGSEISDNQSTLEEQRAEGTLGVNINPPKRIKIDVTQDTGPTSSKGLPCLLPYRFKPVISSKAVARQSTATTAQGGSSTGPMKANSSEFNDLISGFDNLSLPKDPPANIFMSHAETERSLSTFDWTAKSDRIDSAAQTTAPLPTRTCTTKLPQAQSTAGADTGSVRKMQVITGFPGVPKLGTFVPPGHEDLRRGWQRTGTRKK